MPLIKDGHFVADDWHAARGRRQRRRPRRPSSSCRSRGLPRTGAALAEAGHQIGVDITNDTDPASLAPWFDRAAR